MNAIIEDFCNAWKTLDANLIIKHLDEKFVHDSQSVFSSLDYEGYKDYIIGKFHTLKSHGIKIEASIVTDPYMGGKMLMLLQGGSRFFYRIKVKDGKVIKGDMCLF